MKGYVTTKRGCYYAVIYEGLDPITGRGRRTWHAAGTDRAKAEQLADRLAGECNGRNDEVRSDGLAETMTAAGVPAAVVIPAREIARNPQLRHRGLFEIEDHPLTGRHEIPSMPFRFTHVERWARRAAPTLGQHNDEVLAEVLDEPGELDRLRAAGIVGERLGGGSAVARRSTDGG
jgi:crotonobetainyl-CoA:carnitine CoA-transferase CaiB-like acyl-CoA transferase